MVGVVMVGHVSRLELMSGIWRKELGEYHFSHRIRSQPGKCAICGHQQIEWRAVWLNASVITDERHWLGIRNINRKSSTRFQIFRLPTQGSWRWKSLSKSFIIGGTTAPFAKNVHSTVTDSFSLPLKLRISFSSREAPKYGRSLDNLKIHSRRH